MKRFLLVCTLLFSACGILTAQPAARSWSGTTARQFIHRYADPDEIRWGSQDNSFTWQAGYVMFAMEHLWRWTGDPACLDYIRKYVDQNVDQEGRLRQFTPDALDNFLPGYACLLLYELTGETRYARAAETIRRGLDAYPRFDNGMFWHSARIRQVWVDGVFMAQIFLARYASTMGHPEDYAEVVRQMRGITELCGKPDGHFLHGWDESRGAYPEVWSEGMGWLAVLWADVFDYLPEDLPGRDELLDRLRLMCRGLKASQDPRSGMWCQVVDKPLAPGNWNETSGTGMFLYLIQNSIEKGYISADEYAETVDRAYAGLVRKAVVNTDGFVNLTDCSSIGLKRSYEEYIAQPREISTFAAYGSFLLGTGIYEHRMAYAAPDFYATDYSGGKVLRFRNGRIAWEHEAPLSNDIQLLENGNLLFSTGTGVLELDPQGREVLRYDAPCHVFACQRLPDGRTFVGECESGRLLELDGRGRIVKRLRILPKGIRDGGMAFMRNARKLSDGHYLVAHYGEQKLTEYDGRGRVVRSLDLPGGPHSVQELSDGHVLVSLADRNRNPRIVELDADWQEVWSLTNQDLPGAPLRFCSGFQYIEGQGLYLTNWQGHQNGASQPHALLVGRDKRIRAVLLPTDGIQSLSNIAVSPVKAVTGK
ncbi:MAG: glycoside hydrolase family 88 protein [Bacteroidales bacterium]|nr:glycoside hydrolase family 88 protein [Bacteroidales bacterium]